MCARGSLRGKVFVCALCPEVRGTWLSHICRVVVEWKISKNVFSWKNVFLRVFDEITILQRLTVGHDVWAQFRSSLDQSSVESWKAFLPMKLVVPVYWSASFSSPRLRSLWALMWVLKGKLIDSFDVGTAQSCLQGNWYSDVSWIAARKVVNYGSLPVRVVKYLWCSWISKLIRRDQVVACSIRETKLIWFDCRKTIRPIQIPGWSCQWSYAYFKD